MLLWEINLNSRFLRHDELEKCSSDFVEWCLVGLICSSWISIKIGRFFGQNHLYCRYLVPTIFYVLTIFYVFSLFLIFIDDFNSPEELFIFILIPLVLVWLIDVMMNFILRLKYVEHSKITEPALKTLLLTIFCRSCSYGEMGNYIKIQNESKIEPLSHYPRVP